MCVCVCVCVQRAGITLLDMVCTCFLITGLAPFLFCGSSMCVCVCVCADDHACFLSGLTRILALSAFPVPVCHVLCVCVCVCV